jgi:hypothetical protein
VAFEPIHDPDVRAAFDAFPSRMRVPLLRLRQTILLTAAETPGVGPLIETLKWREPAYLPKKPKVGTTIRINAIKASDQKYAAYFHCQTTIIRWCKQTYPDVFVIEGNRALIFEVGQDIPEQPLRHCIAHALTYFARPQ